MGNRLTEQASDTPYGDTFDEALPHYMAMGMGYDEYWDGEYGTKRAWRKAYSLRMENEQRLSDRQSWYMGQYVMLALQAVPLLVAGLNVKEGAHIPEYPNKPFFDILEERKDEEERKRHEEDQMKLAMAMFHAGIEKFNRNLKKRQEAEAKKAAGTGQ